MVVSIVRIRPTRGAATYATTTIISTRRRTPRTKRTVAATVVILPPPRFFRCPWDSDDEDEGLPWRRGPALATSGFLDEDDVLRDVVRDDGYCSPSELPAAEGMLFILCRGFVCS